MSYGPRRDITAGHLVYYQYGEDPMRESGNNWIKHGGYYSAVYSDGTKQGTTTKTCSRINSSTNTYQMGAQHQTVTAAYLFGNGDVLDYYPGSNHASTKKLEMCTNC